MLPLINIQIQTEALTPNFVVKEVIINKVGYMATPVACSWAYAAQEKVTRAFAQEQ